MRCLTLAALAIAPMLLAAQEPVLFAQNFELRFHQWQANHATSTATDGIYDFAFGMPVITYRLGALALTGALSYDRVTARDETYRADSAFGLTSAGARLNLFPYRPFKVRLDYTRTKSPAFFGGEPLRGDIFGAELGYGGRHVHNLILTYRKSSLRQDTQKDSWSTLSLSGLQRFGGTEVSLLAQRQEFDASSYIPAWRNTHAIVRTDTEFSPSWRLRTSGNVENYLGSRWLDGDATLHGFSGPWTVLSTLGYRDTRAGDYHSSSGSVGESLVWTHGKWSLSGSAAFSRLHDSQGQNAQNHAFIAGVNTNLGDGWSVVGSIATTSTSGNLLSASGQKGATSYQVGLLRGGELPDLVRHSLYLFSDWSFDRKRETAYPPGYLPAELADQLVQRRLRQQGKLGFSLDIGRTEERGGGGAQDWARLAGDITAGSNLRMMVLGDFRKDDGFTQPGVRTINKAFTGNASYSLSRVSLTATLGLSQNERAGGSNGQAGPAPVSPLGPELGSTRFEGVGLDLRLRRMPIGVLWTRLDPGVGPRSQALSTHVDLDFRHVSMRLTFSQGWQEDGLHSQQVMFTLRRFFDTVALW